MFGVLGFRVCGLGLISTRRFLTWAENQARGRIGFAPSEQNPVKGRINSLEILKLGLLNRVWCLGSGLGALRTRISGLALRLGLPPPIMLKN